MENNNKKIKQHYLKQILDFLALNNKQPLSGELKKWIEEAEENRDYFNHIKQVWETSVLSCKTLDFNPQKGYTIFAERIKEIENNKPATKQRFYLQKTFKAAAILLPFIFLSYFSYLYFRNNINNSTLSYHQLETPYGSRTFVQLNDGTQIWLNAGSTLAYNDKFGIKKRSVRLTGEAYFEVVHNSDVPFTIESGKVKIEVIGTRFNVNAYQDDPEINVSLLDGSIRMSVEEHPSLILSPDEMVTYNTISNEISRQSLKATDNIAWTQNGLIFKNQRFEQIMFTLERTFNVRITLHNTTLRNRRFSGEFVRNESIEEIFHVMSAGNELQYKINGQTIDIY